MIELIFTIDYEIYGDGQGSLEELVYKPAQKLKEMFQKWNSRFVVFVEVAELEMIEAKGADKAIHLIKDQLRNFNKDSFELGLHLHPWWYKGIYKNGIWHLNYSDYNLCIFQPRHIIKTVDRSIAYLRKILSMANFIPISYRAGHLIFQPTSNLASILAERGIKVDSSVYKGGLWHRHRLDYRKALKNGYYWRFTENTNVPDLDGALLEFPIHTQMVPLWKMVATNQIETQRKATSRYQFSRKVLSRIRDLVRLRYPLKFDFCNMTIDELTRMIDMVIKDDQQDPTSFKPIVSIGHTKDLVDFETVESFLSYLGEKGIKISTFEELYPKAVEYLEAERLGG